MKEEPKVKAEITDVTKMFDIGIDSKYLKIPRKGPVTKRVKVHKTERTICIEEIL